MRVRRTGAPVVDLMDESELQPVSGRITRQTIRMEFRASPEVLVILCNFDLAARYSAPMSPEHNPMSPEHNYHDLGAGMLIDELLGTIDEAIGEYEG